MPDSKDAGPVEVPAVALDGLTIDLRRLHTRLQRIATDLRLAAEEVQRLRLVWRHRTDDPAPSDQHPTFPPGSSGLLRALAAGYVSPDQALDPHD